MGFLQPLGLQGGSEVQGPQSHPARRAEGLIFLPPSSVLSPDGPPGDGSWRSRGGGGRRGLSHYGCRPRSSQYTIRGFSQGMMTDVSPGPPQEGPTVLYTDTISLEFLQRKGGGTENLIVTFISDPRDQGPEGERPLRSHDSPRPCRAGLLALGAHTGHYNQSLTPPRPASADPGTRYQTHSGW